MKGFKTIVILLFIFVTNKSYSQYLSYHHTSFLGTKYFLNDEKVSKKEFIQNLESYSKSKILYKESKKYKNLSTYCNVGQWIMVALQVNEAFDNDTDYGYRYLGANVLLGIGTVYFKNKSNSLFRQSVSNFNRNKMSIGVSYLNGSNNILGVYISLN
jgi:hypothetical protein